MAFNKSGISDKSKKEKVNPFPQIDLNKEYFVIDGSDTHYFYNSAELIKGIELGDVDPDYKIYEIAKEFTVKLSIILEEVK